MQLGVVGLGRMGANIVRRLHRAGHHCVVYDRDPKPGEALARDGAVNARDLAEMVAKLEAPRAIWIMLPAGEITEKTLAELAAMMSPGDTLIDGGNAFWKDDVRRGRDLEAKGLHYLDIGTSGGVHGLERGYCLMIGGDRGVFDRLEPIFRALAPGKAGIPETRHREGRNPTAEQGYLHCGPAGAGHRGGFRPPAQRFRQGGAAGGIRLRLRRRRDRGSVAARLGRDLLAARPHRGGAGRGRGARRLFRPCLGFG